MKNRVVIRELQAPIRARIEGVPAPLKLELRQGADGAMLVAKLGFLRKGAQITLDDPTSGPDATARVGSIHEASLTYVDGDVPELLIALGPIGVPREALRQDAPPTSGWQLEALAPLLGSATLGAMLLFALLGG